MSRFSFSRPIHIRRHKGHSKQCHKKRSSWTTGKGFSFAFYLFKQQNEAKAMARAKKRSHTTTIRPKITGLSYILWSSFVVLENKTKKKSETQQMKIMWRTRKYKKKMKLFFFYCCVLLYAKWYEKKKGRIAKKTEKKAGKSILFDSNIFEPFFLPFHFHCWRILVVQFIFLIIITIFFIFFLFCRLSLWQWWFVFQVVGCCAIFVFINVFICVCSMLASMLNIDPVMNGLSLALHLGRDTYMDYSHNTYYIHIFWVKNLCVLQMKIKKKFFKKMTTNAPLPPARMNRLHNFQCCYMCLFLVYGW